MTLHDLRTGHVFDANDGAGGGAPPTTPPSDAPPAPPTNPPSDAPPAGDQKPLDPAHWEKQAKEHAKEAQSLRTRAAAAEAKLKEIEDAKLTEAEKLKKELDEARAKAQEAEATMTNARILAAASKLGFVDPDDAVALVDREAVKTDLDAALKALLKAKPHLAGTAMKTPGGTANPSASTAQAATKRAEAISMFPALAQIDRATNPNPPR